MYKMVKDKIKLKSVAFCDTHEKANEYDTQVAMGVPIGKFM